MRTYFYKIMILAMAIFLTFGFTSSEPKSTNNFGDSITLLVDHHQWGTSLMSSSTDKKGIKTIKLVFREDFKKVFYVKNTPTSKTVYETDGLKRAIILDNAAGTVRVTEDGKPAVFNEATYQDIAVATALEISGKSNYFLYSVRCTSTVLVISAKKDEAVTSVRNFAAEHLRANTDLSQIGDVMTACVWNDSGCVAFTAFLSSKSGCE